MVHHGLLDLLPVANADAVATGGAWNNPSSWQDGRVPGHGNAKPEAEGAVPMESVLLFEENLYWRAGPQSDGAYRGCGRSGLQYLFIDIDGKGLA